MEMRLKKEQKVKKKKQPSEGGRSATQYVVFDTA